MGFMSILDPIGTGAQAGAQKQGMDKALAAQNKAELTRIAIANALKKENSALYRPFYDKAMPAWDSYTSAINGTIDPNTGRMWTPESSPAFAWQKQQSEDDLNRRLRSMGRSNSTFGNQAFMNNNRNIYASEFDKQLGRLSDLSNIARSSAGSLAEINAGTFKNVDASIGRTGDNQSNYDMGVGSLISGNIKQSQDGIGDLANTAMKMYGGGLFSGSKK